MWAMDTAALPGVDEFECFLGCGVPERSDAPQAAQETSHVSASLTAGSEHRASSGLYGQHSPGAGTCAYCAHVAVAVSCCSARGWRLYAMMEATWIS